MNLSTITVLGVLTKILDNVSSSNEVIAGEVFNNNLTLSTDYGTTRLQLLLDKNVGGNTWWPGSNSTSYLRMDMPNEEMIKGIKINTVKGGYQVTTCRVHTLDAKSSRYVIQGVFITDQTTAELYIKFKEPVKTKSIKLDQFNDKSNSRQPDLTEINLIK